MGFVRSRLKIPIIDFASTTYLSEIKSISKSYLATIFTKFLTSLIEASETFKVYNMFNILVSMSESC